jgi:hypothetical protein
LNIIAAEYVEKLPVRSTNQIVFFSKKNVRRDARRRQSKFPVILVRRDPPTRK